MGVHLDLYRSLRQEPYRGRVELCISWGGGQTVLTGGAPPAYNHWSVRRTKEYLFVSGQEVYVAHLAKILGQVARETRVVETMIRVMAAIVRYWAPRVGSSKNS